MSQYEVMPRKQIGLPDPPHNNDGVTPRPLLAPQRPYITVHYTGSKGTYGDPGDTEVEIRAIQAYAISAKKSFEYNYIIGMDENKYIYEYAGAYLAAHSAGENSEAYGILMLNGISEPPTETQINKFRWLRDLLKFTGSVRPDVNIRQHNQMPGAATACPGSLIIARWNDFLAPYVPPAPPDLPGDCYTKVLAGEGYWQVAARVYASPSRDKVAKLMAANNSAPLTPGMELVVPDVHAS